MFLSFQRKPKALPNRRKDKVYDELVRQSTTKLQEHEDKVFLWIYDSQFMPTQRKIISVYIFWYRGKERP